MIKFELTDEQEAKFEKWRKKLKLKHEDSGAIGGAFSFIFVPTSVGTIVSVKHVSGKELELTEWEHF